MADNSIVLVSDSTSDSSELIPPSRIICKVCHKQFSQYTCPRCNARYCSLPCYKSHSLWCTESFMRENVLGELQQLHTDDEVKKKTLDMLKRFHSEDEVDTMDEDGMSLDLTLPEETMEKILSGSEISYGDLPENEKKQFQRFMVSGELSKLIKLWEPWWLSPSAKTLSLTRDGTQLIQPLVKTPNPENEQSNSIPLGPEEPLTPVNKLTSTEPSPLLAIHLIDIIYSYCFTLRLYNGDYRSDILGSATVVLSMSSVLGHNMHPETVHEALSLCLEQTCSPEFKHVGGVKFGIGLFDDVISFLSLGGSALVCLLSDMQRLIQAAEVEIKLEKLSKSKRVEMRSKLKFVEKKIYFIMCWVHEQRVDVWSSLAAIVGAEKGLVLEFEGNKRGADREKKVETEGKVMIEEI